jgi:D-cysteine desulfhydrase
VCDDPEYFYNYTQGLIDGLNSGLDSHDIVDVINVSALSLIAAWLSLVIV